jgi:hypothetical protein
MSRISPGKRITRPEVLQQARDFLIQIGLSNHSQANLIRYLSAEVIHSDSPSFVRFQPTPHDSDSPAWDQSYSFVSQYLLFHKLTATQEVVKSEKHDELPNIPAISTDEQFHELIGAGPKIPPLPERVEQLFPKKKKKSGQTTSPRAIIKRGQKSVTSQRRRGGKSHGRESPQPETPATRLETADDQLESPPDLEEESGLKIASPPRGGGKQLDSDELGSDILITEIIEKEKE